MIYNCYRKWSQTAPLSEEGVLVGSDVTQEWLLPWWWENYAQTNRHPVTFVDFGLSEPMKRWCTERGTLLRLWVPDLFVVEQAEIASDLVQTWEEAYGKQFWESRNGWFKKPLACLLSPYVKTIWLDLDCEIRGSLQDLFPLCMDPSGIVLAEEQEKARDKIEGIYGNFEDQPTSRKTDSSSCFGINSGVIVFRRGISLMEEWAERSLDETALYPGDQDVLTAILREKQIDFGRLPLVYNWSRRREENLGAIVVHWHGSHGKTVLRHHIAKKLSGIL